MNYLSKCRIISKGTDILVIGPCINCHKEQTIQIPQTSVIKSTMGQYVQDILPDLSAGEREFLISGCCEPCFDRMFAE